MSNDEFERIRAAITAAANIVGDAMEAEGGHKWDYVIVAVPVDNVQTRIAMMSSVMPEGLPHFLKFIEAAFRNSAAKHTVVDDRQPEGKPS